MRMDLTYLVKEKHLDLSHKAIITCCVQETYLKQSDSERLKIKQKLMLYQSNGNNKKTGVSISISSKRNQNPSQKALNLTRKLFNAENHNLL